MSLFFITGNKDKFHEVASILPGIQQLNIDLPEIQDIDPHTIIKAKLQEALQHHAGQLIVEDTSLYLECLNGLPGPLIKWFLKTIGNEGLYKIANKLDNNKAVAKSIVGYAKNPHDISFFEGQIQGQIVSPRGENGFGWDAIFLPDGHNKTFAEMTQEEKYKGKMNMRKIALLELKKQLEIS